MRFALYNVHCCMQRDCIRADALTVLYDVAGSANDWLCRWHVGVGIHFSSRTQAVSGQQETTREANWDWARGCMAVNCLHDEFRLLLVTLRYSHMPRDLRHVSVNINNTKAVSSGLVHGAVHVQAPRLCTSQLVQSTPWQCQQQGSCSLGAMAHAAV